MPANSSSPSSDRTRVKRLPERGHYDRETVHAILDAGFICHVGYVIDGQPYVTPTSYWRDGDHVYWHGSSASRMLRAQSQRIPVCFTVTLVDGLVLARSAFHHSMNYRSVMALGEAEMIAGVDAKTAALRAFVERMVPERWNGLRPVTSQEVKATTVLRLALDEASAKIRVGPPKDEAEDYALPIWAGIVPLSINVGQPHPDPKLVDGAKGEPDVRTIRIG